MAFRSILRRFISFELYRLYPLRQRRNDDPSRSCIALAGKMAVSDERRYLAVCGHPVARTNTRHADPHGNHQNHQAPLSFAGASLPPYGAEATMPWPCHGGLQAQLSGPSGFDSRLLRKGFGVQPPAGKDSSGSISG